MIFNRRRAVTSIPTFRALALVAATLVLPLVAAGQSHPIPATVPYRWELNFQPGPVRLYIDPLEQQPYWFFTYMVTNRTGRVQVWAPRFTLFTDSGEILDAGRDVPARVMTDLIDLMGNPLMQDQNEIIGDIHHGREHAKEGLVAWPARDLDLTELSLFIAGISGETARVINPVTREEMILRKTLERQYLVPGDPAARGTEPLELIEQRWVMR